MRPAKRQCIVPASRSSPCSPMPRFAVAERGESTIIFELDFPCRSRSATLILVSSPDSVDDLALEIENPRVDIDREASNPQGRDPRCRNIEAERNNRPETRGSLPRAAMSPFCRKEAPERGGAADLRRPGRAPLSLPAVGSRQGIHLFRPGFLTRQARYLANRSWWRDP